MEKQFECTTCNLSFLNKYIYETHLKTDRHKYKQIEKPFDCIICNFSCTTNSRYKMHLVSTTHKNIINPPTKIMYECKLCNYSNSCKLFYERHLTTKKHKKNNPIIEFKIQELDYSI